MAGRAGRTTRSTPSSPAGSRRRPASPTPSSSWSATRATGCSPPLRSPASRRRRGGRRSGLLASLWADLATHRDGRRRRVRRPHPPCTAGRARVGGAARAARGRGPSARLPAAAHSPSRSRSLSWPTGWTGGCARSSACWRRPRPCTSPRWPGSARWPSGVRDAQARARELLEPDDPDGAALAALACAVDARLAACTNDPLRSRPGCPATSSTVSQAAPGTARTAVSTPIEARLAERAAVRDAWADRRREVADAIAALDALCDREAHARRAALDRVAGVVFAAPAGPAARAAPPARRSARAATGRGVPRPRCPASPRTSALRRTPCAPPSGARPG